MFYIKKNNKHCELLISFKIIKIQYLENFRLSPQGSLLSPLLLPVVGFFISLSK
jgi:hypothetical protein